MHASVFAQDAAGGVANLALRLLWSDAALAEVGIDEGRIIAIRDEANFLAIWLGGHRQSQFARQVPHLRLGVTAEGKIGLRQLLLFQTEEKIGLIFRMVHAAAHLIAARGFVKPDARVMACRDP